MKNLRGEMTLMAREERGETEGLDVITAITQALQLSTAEDIDQVNIFPENLEVLKYEYFKIFRQCNLRVDSIFKYILLNSEKWVL